ncbi:AarF/UbiB family protein [Paenibacillus hodogayensis]|uniref:AarF/UbiB family protein n=1 Tax=Paenibacillus hodogayensis TaxID=279208 RepID=A0ABV5VT12_9BACL
MDDYKRITVKPVIMDGKSKLEVHNPTSYPLIGAGAQGAVFLLSAKRCVKIYESPHSAAAERAALAAARGSAFFPKLYESGEKYVVMEYIEGPTLQDVLRKDTSRFDDAIAAQLIAILKEMRSMNFARIDTRIGHILIPSTGGMKVIDHSGAFRITSRAPFRLIKSLHQAHVLPVFLRYAARHEPKLYRKWLRKWEEGTNIEGVPPLPPLEQMLTEAGPEGLF